MISLLPDTIRSYSAFRAKLDLLFKEDLHQQFPDLDIPEKQGIMELLGETGESFVFVIDEWDALFEQSFMTAEDREQYILFLSTLFKPPYVHFAYMTGILPIARYTSGSPLSMFHEFSAFHDSQFYPYFGLSREEIQALIQKNGFRILLLRI